MLGCMLDIVHDAEHVYRVLFAALDIARYEENVNYDVLITACLLHDIGRVEEIANSSLDHAAIGAQKAADFLTTQGFSLKFIQHVYNCIITHRFRTGRVPESIEAKILFDADKLDVSGAMGIVRSLLWEGKEQIPIFNRLNGYISDGSGDSEPSFLQEYHIKLEQVYDYFFTEHGEELAIKRQKISKDFYNSLMNELMESYEGAGLLSSLLTEK